MVPNEGTEYEGDTQDEGSTKDEGDTGGDTEDERDIEDSDTEDEEKSVKKRQKGNRSVVRHQG